MPTRTLDLVLVNRPAEISRLVDHLEAFGAKTGLASDVSYRLTLSLDEVVANVIRHGFEDDADSTRRSSSGCASSWARSANRST